MRYDELVGSRLQVPITIKAFKRGPDLEIFATHDGVVVASATYSETSRTIDRIWVRKSFRRKGIASAIHRWVEDKTGMALFPADKLSADGRAFWKARGAPDYELDRRPLVGTEWAEDVIYGE